MRNVNLSKKTKIVCTIGPASDKMEIFRQLYEQGMNIMRLNFSHGTYEEQEQKLLMARELEKENIFIVIIKKECKF